MATPDLIYAPLPANDIPAALAIEQEEYPEDEAGSLESFTLRQSQAPSLFLGAYTPLPNGEPGELIGYICSTLSDSDTLTHSSMSTHVPGGSSVCIHSVCVKRSYQQYIKRVKDDGGYERILLIAHDNLRQLYEKAGFEWLGESSVVHGKQKWYEMRIVLKSAAQPQSPTSPKISQEVLQSLLRPSSQKRSPAMLSEFSGTEDLATEDTSSPGVLVNRYDLLCPRGCRGIILKSNSAQFVERTSVLKMEPTDAPANRLLPSLPPPPETANWWLITGSPMSFENIGFTRPVGNLSATPGKRMKLLICGECDLGPLGWCEEGGNEFWLAVGRVGYRRE
ncbi:acyl-CoA N-acyltransferase [Coprinopsis sp. MPI-PUGE-AT-0042]|nr:acyl-CoA N-acyltransferase [Coprinopsis sp. MPI-PUGE-AT-0042]